MSNKSGSWTRSSLGLGPNSGGLVRHHPSELLLRTLFSRRYCSLAPKLTPRARVLDIGTMYGNNLVPFHDRGAVCFGVEINAEMAAIAREAALVQGLDVSISLGRNRQLPFADAMFDVLLAINVIHYEDDRDGLLEAMEEYKRVLAPEGRAFIVSAGPEHQIRSNAERLGPNRHRINASDDFRQGQVMAYFEDEADLATTAGEVFSQVATGRMIEIHDQAKVDFIYALCGA
jgi:SAM-dependent methyltransferase